MKRNLLQYRHSREITVSGTTTTRQNSANEFGSVLTSPNRTQKKKRRRGDRIPSLHLAPCKGKMSPLPICDSLTPLRSSSERLTAPTLYHLEQDFIPGIDRPRQAPVYTVVLDPFFEPISKREGVHIRSWVPVRPEQRQFRHV